MGNYCFCDKTHIYIKDIKINICPDKQNINLKSEHILNKNENKIPEKRIYKLKKYFNENEEEIIKELYKKEKIKNLTHKKKRQSFTNYNKDNKYELMLKRLLEQKNIKRNGPKRRETIKKEAQIKSLITETLNENRNKIYKNKSEKYLKRNNSILLIKNSSKVRFSTIIDKGEKSNILRDKFNKKLNDQYLKNIITFNEALDEGNGSSRLGKKETNNK